MAESGIPEKLLPAIRLAIFWIALPFIGVLLGGERISEDYEHGLWVSMGSMVFCSTSSQQRNSYWSPVPDPHCGTHRHGQNIGR